MKETKFRVWDPSSNTMYYTDKDDVFLTFYNAGKIPWGLYDARDGRRIATGDENAVFNTPGNLMQYTGLKDKNKKDIYNGDIFRVEEDEMMFYLVIVWIQEWCMFCTLRIDDEYPAYQMQGIEALDEPMFWTYTLEDTDSRKFFLCGNIYQNPDLLKAQDIAP